MYNITVNINVFLFFVAATSVGFLVAKAIIYLFSLFFEGKINDYFEDKGITRTSKRVIHNEIIKMCSEGKSSGWQMRPRNLEHLYFVANTAKKWNFDLGSKIDDYIDTWVTYVGFGSYAVSSSFIRTLMKDILDKLKLLDIAILHQASKEFEGVKKR